MSRQTKKFLEIVITREPCPKHAALMGEACWSFQNATGVNLQGVCNKRAEKAGFHSPISDAAMQRTSQRTANLERKINAGYKERNSTQRGRNSPSSPLHQGVRR